MKPFVKYLRVALWISRRIYVKVFRVVSDGILVHEVDTRDLYHITNRVLQRDLVDIVTGRDYRGELCQISLDVNADPPYTKKQPFGLPFLQYFT